MSSLEFEADHVIGKSMSIGRARAIASIKLGLAALLFYALRPSNDHDYYVLLRFVCLSVFGFLAYEAVRVKAVGWAWTFATLALLYNPFVALGLHREVWEYVNVASAMILLASIRAKWPFGRRATFGVAAGTLATAALVIGGYVVWTREGTPESSVPSGSPATAQQPIVPLSCRAIRYAYTDAYGRPKGTVHGAVYAITYSDGTRHYSSVAPAGVSCVSQSAGTNRPR